MDCKVFGKDALGMMGHHSAVGAVCSVRDEEAEEVEKGQVPCMRSHCSQVTKILVSHRGGARTWAASGIQSWFP